MLPKTNELMPLGGQGEVVWIYPVIPANRIEKVSVCQEHYLTFYFLILFSFFCLSKMKKMVTLMEIVEEIKRIAVRRKMIR